MTSIIKVNNLQNQCGANTINKCGTTLTIGASGDTISLASGASQTGFGRTGTVDWITTPKTATFTAVSGEGYFCNTTSGTFEVDLPAGVAGAIVSIQDYNNTFDSNNLTVDPNGSEKINGGTAGGFITLSTEGLGITFVYIDATVGWRSVQSNEYSTAGITPAFVTGTGGTITCSGDYRIHTFTGPGTFCVSCAGNPSGSATVDYMVVAGGGSGPGGGGGAGGLRESSGAASGCYSASPLGACVSALPASVQGYSITVGAAGSNVPCAGSKGNNSIFSTITSTGGGGGGVRNVKPGQPGGSGGGGSDYNNFPGGTGNTPPVSPPQGNNGGTGGVPATESTGGGGGAGGAGSGYSPGPGVSSSISGSSVPYAIGGSGECYPGNPLLGPGTTIAGIGRGSDGNSANAGIVIIRYKFQ